jgi:segregation and condensation protein A
MKLSAARLDELPQALRDYEWVTVWIAEKVVQRLPDVNVHDLQLAWLAVVKRARVMQHHKVRREELSVREHMAGILRRLRGGGYVEFVRLFDPERGVPSLVVSFLAVLELVREKLVQVVQREVFAPVYVRLAQVEGESAMEDAGHEPA